MGVDVAVSGCMSRFKLKFRSQFNQKEKSLDTFVCNYRDAG